VAHGTDRLLTRPVLWVGAVAAAVRVLWALVASRTPTGLSDPILYYGAARSIADGRGYTAITGTMTSYYPPGYPLFLGALQWTLDRVGLGDHLPLATGLVQALLGGVAAGALVVAGTRLGRSWPRPLAVGVAAGLVFALWPNLIGYSAAILSESLFLCLFAVFLASVLTMGDAVPVPGEPPGQNAVGATGRDGADAAGTGPRVWAGVRPVRGALAALSLGGATLVRPQALAAAAAVVLAWIVCRVGWRTVLVRGAWLATGVIVVVAPWTIRNADVFGAFVPVSNNDGDNLCIGFHEGASGHFEQPVAVCETVPIYAKGPAAELRRNTVNRRIATDWIRSNLAELPGLSVRKLWYTYRTDTDSLRAVESYDTDRFLGGWRHPLEVVWTIAYLAIMAATLAGAVLAAVRGWRVRRDDNAPLAVLAAALASFLVPVLVFGDPRFKVHATPCFALLAGLAVVAALDALRSRRDTDEQVQPSPATT